MDDLPSVKTLGIVWPAFTDELSFSKRTLADDSCNKEEVFQQDIKSLSPTLNHNSICD